MDTVTVIGNAVVDVLAEPVSPKVFQSGSEGVKQIRLSYGGDALNESVLLSRFGKKVELISRLGQDEAGERILTHLKKNGVSTEKIRLDKDLETSVNLVLIDEKGERYFFTTPQGSQRRLEEGDILSHINQAGDIVSFASMFISTALDIPAMTRVFRKVKEKPGRILAADVTKPKNGETIEDLRELLPLVDFFFSNEQEAAMLTGSQSPYESGKSFVEAGVGCALIKRGEKGCIVCTKNETLEIPACPARECVDTTGAGDSFAAGFLWALSERYSLPDCARFACAVSSCAVETVGAGEGIPSLEEPMRRFKECYR